MDGDTDVNVFLSGTLKEGYGKMEFPIINTSYRYKPVQCNSIDTFDAASY